MECVLPGDKIILERMDSVEILARENPAYMEALEECFALEEDYFDVMEAITQQQAGVIYDFFSAYSRLLELRLETACMHMHFSE